MRRGEATAAAPGIMKISGIEVENIIVGTGAEAKRGDFVTVRWAGTLNHSDPIGDGEESFRAGGRDVVAGLSYGVIGMRVGGVRQLRVSPHLGYGDQAVAGIPANAVLVFEVSLLSVVTRDGTYAMAILAHLARAELVDRSVP
jgi:FKBP-type peptidyl-prolyl cis-trans isomerase